MSRIVIKDLPESVDLDREAMVAITGGARVRGRYAFPGPTILRTSRVVAYPGGFATAPAPDAKAPTARGKAAK